MADEITRYEASSVLGMVKRAIEQCERVAEHRDRVVALKDGLRARCPEKVSGGDIADSSSIPNTLVTIEESVAALDDAHAHCVGVMTDMYSLLAALPDADDEWLLEELYVNCRSRVEVAQAAEVDVSTITRRRDRAIDHARVLPEMRKLRTSVGM